MVLLMLVATAIYLFTFFCTRERVVDEAAHASDIRGDLKALFTNIGWVVLFVSALFNLIHVAVRNGSLLFYFDYYVGDESKASLYFWSGSLAFMAGILCINLVADRFRKKHLLVFLTCTMGVGLFLLYFVPPDQYGVMLGGLMNGLLLESFGYVANAEQSQEALKAIVMLVSVIPAAFSVLSGLTIAFYPLTEPVMLKVEQELSERRAGLAA